MAVNRGNLPYRLLTGIAGAAAGLAAPVAGTGWRQRLGMGPPRADIWLHAASVGEVASAALLVQALARRHILLVTTNTVTGRAAAEALGVPAVLAPLDTPQALRRFLAAVRPRIAVTVENELWPNRSAALAREGVSQVVVGARLSARSAARWGRMPGVIGPMLARLDALSAQDAGSEGRLVALGLRQDALLPRLNLKLLGPARQGGLAEGPHRARTLLAASTHEGEEALILDAVQTLGPDAPRLIIAPRHPRRFDAVARLMEDRGLTPARRSAGAGAEAPVLLADSMAEMPLWYAAAGICLTGGSLVPVGGHTPWEPAAQGCAILHGPHLDNFTEDYARLDAAGGARPVTAATLAATVAQLLHEPGLQQRMGGQAQAVLMREAGRIDALVTAIENILCV